jgi:hypothetical protein
MVERPKLEAGHSTPSGDRLEWVELYATSNPLYSSMVACVGTALRWSNFVYCYRKCVQFLAKEQWNLAFMAFIIKFHFRIHKGFHAMRFVKVLINVAFMETPLYFLRSATCITELWDNVRTWWTCDVIVNSCRIYAIQRHIHWINVHILLNWVLGFL